jgi:transketolase
VNGHDLQEMDLAIERAKNEKFRPSMIILDTIKGKGAHFAERRLDNHNMVFDYETAKEACRLLGN